MILVGAPVFERAWILQHWFDCLARQEGIPAKDIGIVLNYGDGNDDTLSIIEAEWRSGRWAKVTFLFDANTDHEEPRKWQAARYLTMVRLRNDLLTYVRAEKPAFYLSCDTDMLLPPQTLRVLLDHLGDYDGIAPLAFMSDAGKSWPNFMDSAGKRSRIPAGTTPQHAVFGTVLMTPELYDVDYALHGAGEDMGWANNVAHAGLRLALCTDVTVKHVMVREQLSRFDLRVGF